MNLCGNESGSLFNAQSYDLNLSVVEQITELFSSIHNMN